MSPPPTALRLRNLGPASARMLAAAGVHTAEQLHASGAVAAFLAVQDAGLKPSLNLLWALEGALTQRDWKEVARQERTPLLLQLDDALQARKAFSTEPGQASMG
jgi:DNA transformation protein